MAKICPHCKTSTQFKGFVTKTALLNATGEDVVVQQEGKVYNLEIKGCAGCNTPVEESELIEAHTCCKCNELIPTVEMKDLGSDNYICVACDALETREDLQGLSQQALVRRLLELEGKAGIVKDETAATAEEKVKA